MALQIPVALSGAPGSPYTRKMLSLLRYRRIPHRYLLNNSQAQAAMPQPKVRLLPTFYLPGEAGELEAVTDSTPTIRRLEAEADADRAAVDAGRRKRSCWRIRSCRNRRGRRWR